jgi:hypothetical protein
VSDLVVGAVSWFSVTPGWIRVVSWQFYTS